jgi:hypothetical protein
MWITNVQNQRSGSLLKEYATRLTSALVIEFCREPRAGEISSTSLTKRHGLISRVAGRVFGVAFALSFLASSDVFAQLKTHPERVLLN